MVAIIDTNNIFNTIAGSLFYKKKSFMDGDNIYSYIKDCHRHVCYLLKDFEKHIDTIIFVGDSGMSWRKELDFGDYANTYKIHRDEKKKKMWDNRRLIEAMDVYFSVLETVGINSIRIASIEADDIIYYLSAVNVLNKKNTVIFSGDSDMRQLLYESKDCFVWLRDCNSGRLKAGGSMLLLPNNHPEYGKSVTPDDNISMMFDDNIISIDDPMEIAGMCGEVIDQNKELFVKILSGDTSDMVPSCYYYPSKNGVKMISYTKLRAERLADELENNEYLSLKYGKCFSRDFINSMYDSDDLKRIIATNVIESVKQEITDDNINAIVKGIDRNLKLIYLSKKVIPEQIINSMRNLIKLNDFYGNLSGRNFDYKILDNTILELEDREGYINYKDY